MGDGAGNGANDTGADAVSRVRRNFIGASIALLIIAAACGKGGGAGDSSAAGGDSIATPPADTTPTGWVGRYALRGTLEGSRQATGAVGVTRLEPGSAAHDSTQQRVRATYPSYDGPLYRAELAIAAGDSVRSTFTCANSPSTPPALVCHPSAPIPQLRDAALVMQPDGRATLSGSHGEGVTAEYGTFTWERSPGT
jgi:hypothetical protein